ncbi:MAG: hypothetical protein PWP23_2455 [Candidatus Sumerlaeota bacterium]|nr:hypothetical protein [Candidatus Sumerlaeota bacterium]
MKFAKSNNSMRPARQAFPLVLLAALVAGGMLTGCDGRRETREVLNMPDMHFQQSFKPQEPNPWAENGTMMTPPEGTVPIGFQPYTIGDLEADELASKLQNPLEPTEDVLRVGRKYYGVFCIGCHGETGNGMGNVVTVNAGMPIPPSLYSEKLRSEWTDGRIFHVITRGQGNMPPYDRIDPDKRWAIIHYVRSLQRAATPTEEDLQMVEGFKTENPELFRNQDGKE